MMTNEEQHIKQLREMILELQRRVNFLERENNRRKSEITQVTNAFRRGQ